MIKSTYEKVKKFIPITILTILIIFYWNVLIPFAISAVIAYLINPLVKIMEKKMKRGFALTIIMGVLIMVVTGILLVVLPWIISETITLINNFPYYMGKLQEYSLIEFPYKEEIIKKISNEINMISKVIMTKSTGLFLGGMTILGYVVSVPIFTFYMLKDKEVICRFFWNFLPEDKKKKAAEILKKIDTRMQGFIKGQFLDFLGLAIMLSIAFTIVGVNNGIAIAIICAIFNLIPYIGMIFSLILVGGVSWFQHLDIMFVVKAVGSFGVIQFFENMIMAPNLVGSNAKVHPLAIVLAIMVFGGTFGLTGVLLAIPGLIVVDVLMNLKK